MTKTFCTGGRTCVCVFLCNPVLSHYAEHLCLFDVDVGTFKEMSNDSVPFKFVFE